MNENIKAKIRSKVGSVDGNLLIAKLESLEIEDDVQTDEEGISIPVALVESIEKFQQELQILSKTGRAFAISITANRIQINTTKMKSSLSSSGNNTASEIGRRLKMNSESSNQPVPSVSSVEELKHFSDENINLQQLTEVRVIVDKGRGFGNQRANLTAMLRLRELGFQGKFDIHYRELYPADYLSPLVQKDVGCVGRQLMTLIPEFKANENYTIHDQGTELDSATLGNIKITRLPASELAGYPLSPTQLTITGADDSAGFLNLPGHNPLPLFKTRFFLCFQPTDWLHPRIIFTPKESIDQPESARLSTESSLRYIPSKTEQTVQTLLTTLHAQDVMSQLVYGLYPHEKLVDEPVGNGGRAWIQKLVSQPNLQIETEVKNLIAAHCIMLKQQPQKTSLLIFPQSLEIFNKPSNILQDLAKQYGINICILQPGEYPATSQPGTIFISHSVKFSPGFFDDLMLRRTTLPPVIEGCNSIETCEMQGRLYLHGSGLNVRINNYGETSYPDDLSLHRDACLPLETGDANNIERLVMFMELASNGHLDSYAQARRDDHRKRVDIVETSLKIIKCQYNNASESKHNHFEAIAAEGDTSVKQVTIHGNFSSMWSALKTLTQMPAAFFGANSNNEDKNAQSANNSKQGIVKNFARKKPFE